MVKKGVKHVIAFQCTMYCKYTVKEWVYISAEYRTYYRIKDVKCKNACFAVTDSCDMTVKSQFRFRMRFTWLHDLFNSIAFSKNKYSLYESWQIEMKKFLSWRTTSFTELLKILHIKHTRNNIKDTICNICHLSANNTTRIPRNHMSS